MEQTNGAEKDESPNIGELAQALAKAQGSFPAVAKSSEAEMVTKTGQKIRYSYADLASIWEAIRAPLAANGLAVVQVASSSGPDVVVTTTLMHASGQWIRGRLSMPVATSTPQAFGSAITYAKKYSLAAMVGVAAEEDDDDGGAASKPLPRPPPTTQQAPAPASPPPVTGSRSAEVKQAARRVSIQEEPPPNMQPPPGFEEQSVMPYVPPEDEGPQAVWPFRGSNKGLPLSSPTVTKKDLNFLIEATAKSISDPTKAEWKAKNEELLAAAQRELSRR